MWGIDFLESTSENYRDPLWIKILVYALVALETVHGVLAVHFVFAATAVDHPSLELAWSATVIAIVTSCIEILVQFFYARRIWIVSNKKVYVPALVVCLSIVKFSTGQYGASAGMPPYHFSDMLTRQDIVKSAFAVGAATDVLIAASLTYYLHQNRSPFHRTNTIINSLIVYAISNGALTSAFFIVVYIFDTRKLHILALYMIIGSLYTNSMLAT
ncbi:hypothetical protein HGRIS_000420 [Hohenbuehelia grisea]|uniref:DUF6534 domain-containing protein n=1 Tax=Hohenbuehelia grisea TaxID=104357 RepID=A0ABR3JSK8_9AGAR